MPEIGTFCIFRGSAAGGDGYDSGMGSGDGDGDDSGDGGGGYGQGGGVAPFTYPKPG